MAKKGNNTNVILAVVGAAGLAGVAYYLWSSSQTAPTATASPSFSTSLPNPNQNSLPAASTTGSTDPDVTGPTMSQLPGGEGIPGFTF